jgi:hypothetical protein
MPTPTYTPLANITLGSSAASVTFSSITSYRDYILVANGAGSSGGSCYVRLNGDTGSNYPTVTMRADNNGTITSATYTTGYWYAGGLSNNRFDVMLQVEDASATDKHKTILARTGVGAVQVQASAIRWSNTAAVTSITVVTDAGTFAAGSTFALYGIAS